MYSGILEAFDKEIKQSIKMFLDTGLNLDDLMLIIPDRYSYIKASLKKLYKIDVHSCKYIEPDTCYIAKKPPDPKEYFKNLRLEMPEIKEESWFFHRRIRHDTG